MKTIIFQIFKRLAHVTSYVQCTDTLLLKEKCTNFALFPKKRWAHREKLRKVKTNLKIQNFKLSIFISQSNKATKRKHRS